MKSSIIKDRVTLDRFTALNYATSCEDCAHFDAAIESCTFGFPTAPHLRKNQILELKENGEMAFCRVMEID